MAFALTNARIVTATGAEPIEVGAIVVAGERISWVGSVSDFEPSRHGLDGTVDCTGRTIVPGLVDAHAHLVYWNVSDPYTIELSKSIEEATIDAALNASKLLELGFTSVRDVGTRGNIASVVRDAVEAGRLPGPRIRASKQIISVWGGLGDFHPTHIFRREQLASALTEIVTGPWEARNAVRQHVKDGADWIKVEASGTGFNPLCPAERDTISLEELRAVVDEASEKERPVACHAESRRSIVKAASAGVRTVEHAVYLDDEGTEAVLENGVAICPTLALYTAYAERGLEFGIPAEIVANHRRTHERHVEAIRKAHEAGVTIIAGSDSGLTNFPQGGGLQELCSYVELIGMSPYDALLTATRDAARVVGFPDAGTLEAGKRADVLVLRANPLDRIRTLLEPDNLEAVIKNGELAAGSLPAAHAVGVA